MAVEGTTQEADSAQLPQSFRPVVASATQAGWLCGKGTEGEIAAMNRAPLPA